MQRLIATAALLLAPLSASAQTQSEDWDYGEDPARNLTIASTSFENFGVAIRCMDDALALVVSGLPANEGVRRFGYRMGDAPERETQWVSGADSAAAFSLYPRYMAQEMARGGRLALSVPHEGRTRRYAVDLPPSEQAIGRVFSACGRELETAETDAAPRDENLAGLRWVRPVEVSYPSRPRYGSGLAAVSCDVLQTGRLRGCRVESEFPEGGGFGRAAVIGAHRSGEVEAVDGSDADIEGRTITFMARFNLRDAAMQPPPSRLPGRDEAYNPVPKAQDD